MADQLLINHLIYVLGLKGQDAEKKRKEFESANLSNEELTRLIANVQTFGPTALGCFSSLDPKKADKVSKIFSGTVSNDASSWGLVVDKDLTPPPRNSLRVRVL